MTDNTNPSLNEDPHASLNEVLKTQIAKIGYAVVRSKNYQFTVGLGAHGFKDIIVATNDQETRLLAILASKLVHGEIFQTPNKKFSLEELVIRTEILGDEPMRLMFSEFDQAEDGAKVSSQELIRQVDYKQHVRPGHLGYITIETPDTDNRLFGEVDCEQTVSAREQVIAVLVSLLNEAAADQASITPETTA